jgi:hypothetical protein
MNEVFRTRRQWLRLIAAGVGGAGFSAWMSEALAKGDKPIAPSIHHLEGTAKVNGRDAAVGTPVNMGDRVITGPRSQAVIVLGGDAFLLRSDTSIEVKGSQGTLSELSIAAGKVLSVFAKKPVVIKAATASIGIRGTGAYVEIDPGSVYFCLCYGEAQVEGPGIAPRSVKTTHHEQPLLLGTQGAAMRIEPGAFRDHKDAELVMLESLVGREPPFVRDGAYPANKY